MICAILRNHLPEAGWRGLAGCGGSGLGGRGFQPHARTRHVRHGVPLLQCVRSRLARRVSSLRRTNLVGGIADVPLASWAYRGGAHDPEQSSQVRYSTASLGGRTRH